MFWACKALLHLLVHPCQLIDQLKIFGSNNGEITAIALKSGDRHVLTQWELLMHISTSIG